MIEFKQGGFLLTGVYLLHREAIIIDTYLILNILGVEIQEPCYLLKKIINDKVLAEKGSR